MAPRDILPGADWGSSILRALARARLFVLVFSSRANVSPQVKREVERAVHRGIPLIPLRIEDALPTDTLEFFLTTSHWLDAFEPPLQKHLDYLADVIPVLLTGDEAIAPAAPAASAPVLRESHADRVDDEHPSPEHIEAAVRTQTAAMEYDGSGEDAPEPASAAASPAVEEPAADRTDDDQLSSSEHIEPVERTQTAAMEDVHSGEEAIAPAASAGSPAMEERPANRMDDDHLSSPEPVDSAERTQTAAMEYDRFGEELPALSALPELAQSDRSGAEDESPFAFREEIVATEHTPIVAEGDRSVDVAPELETLPGPSTARTEPNHFGREDEASSSSNVHMEPAVDAAKAAEASRSEVAPASGEGPASTVSSVQSEPIAPNADDEHPSSQKPMEWSVPAARAAEVAERTEATEYNGTADGIPALAIPPASLIVPTATELAACDTKHEGSSAPGKIDLGAESPEALDDGPPQDAPEAPSPMPEAPEPTISAAEDAYDATAAHRVWTTETPPAWSPARGEALAPHPGSEPDLAAVAATGEAGSHLAGPRSVRRFRQTEILLGFVVVVGISAGLIALKNRMANTVAVAPVNPVVMATPRPRLQPREGQTPRAPESARSPTTAVPNVSKAIAYPPEISGVPQVRDTATLIVNGQHVSLAGIEGFGGHYADQFRGTLAQFGNSVRCDRVGDGPSYDCSAGRLQSLSAMDLRNGIARTNASATAAQRTLQAKAAKEHRGIWGAAGVRPDAAKEP